MVDRGFDRASIDRSLAFFSFEVVPFDADQAAIAAELRRTTRSKGLSLGDRACLALAVSRGTVALTTDRIWGEIDLPVEIRVLR
jgi:PIN domain nuclease of toxin-antitoxin system